MKLKNDFKELSNLIMDIPAISPTKEGGLRGGFYAVSTLSAEAYGMQDSCETGCQNECQNSCVIGTCQNSCKKSCQNACKTGCSVTTPTTPPTNPTVPTLPNTTGKSMVGFSFIF